MRCQQSVFVFGKTSLRQEFSNTKPMGKKEKAYEKLACFRAFTNNDFMEAIKLLCATYVGERMSVKTPVKVPSRAASKFVFVTPIRKRAVGLAAALQSLLLMGTSLLMRAACRALSITLLIIGAVVPPRGFPAPPSFHVTV